MECSNCKKPLHGIEEGKKLAKSKKNVNRPYGGSLCSRCARMIFKEKVRGG